MRLITHGNIGFTKVDCGACGSCFEYHVNEVYEELRSFGDGYLTGGVKFMNAVKCPVCTGVIYLEGE